MSACFLCPRRCGVVRPLSRADASSLPGVCRSPRNPVAARAALHRWEEPVISGTKGSGAVFFSGCNLHCVFCQNYGISAQGDGWEITPARLREIYFELIGQGAHNINLVTPTHFAEAVLESLEGPALPVPVVYNTNGYDLPETLRRFEGKVSIWLPDMKYSDDSLARKFSGAPDYFERASEAILEMYRQTGPYVMDPETGLLKSGVVIRHLILPGFVENSKNVIRWVTEHFKPGEVMFSLMRQYLPCGAVSAEHFPELNRRVSEEEYSEVENFLFESGIEDGFVQEEESAEAEFIPLFDGTGV
ncbi:MAG: radical SAM protein [Lentisphaeria bacterium]|nr:radical SAM protein [Lentisphaeria bacterium]